MKTKNCYIKPNIEVINLEVKENIMEVSGDAKIDMSDNPTTSVGRSRRRSFWDNEEE